MKLDDKQFKRDLIQAVAEGIAYEFDHKKKDSVWTNRDIGVYFFSAGSIVNDHVMPILKKHFENKEVN